MLLVVQGDNICKHFFKVHKQLFRGGCGCDGGGDDDDDDNNNNNNNMNLKLIAF
jgi:hypothetical protein